MEWAEWMQWLIPAISALLGGSGVWALLGARAAGKATERAAEAAAQATERAAEAAANATERAAALASTPAVQSATTADWTALMSYWQAEMTAMRSNAAALEVRVLFLEHQREEDLRHIEVLEQHIWNELPPPPPTRRRIPFTKPDPEGTP
ncbi:MAG TPA: hypothetical protein VJ617_19930 [Arthrobacter sp.]|nr:hypothetical protein [Arthrobacter sp.]